MDTIKVELKKLSHFDENIELPFYQTNHAAGADIRACLPDKKEIIIPSGARVLIPTGLAMAIPQGYEIQVRPRSGLSLKTDLLVVHSPGTIDADYRGEVKIIMGNFGNTEHSIKHGERVAQLILAPVLQANFKVVDFLSETLRGEGGFGSTGVS